MKSMFSNSSHQPLHVLVVGNNPIEMGSVLEKLHRVKKRKVVTEIAFDIRSTIERLSTFNPNFILIDDNFLKRLKLWLQQKKLVTFRSLS